MAEPLKLPTLLIIADNPAIGHWIKKNFEDRLYILEAETQSFALETAKMTRLDFIVLDSHFEESNALELSQKLRQINPTTPIFLITSRLKKQFRKNALAAGITDFLSDQLAVEELQTRMAIGQQAAKARKKISEISSRIKELPSSKPKETS